jgi:hypothetical protein
VLHAIDSIHPPYCTALIRISVLFSFIKLKLDFAAAVFAAL